MRNELETSTEEAVKSDWDLRKYFEQLRLDEKHHLGLGDIRLTIGQQEEICKLLDRSYIGQSKAITAAVLAERRRVWDAVAKHLAAVESNIEAADTDESIANYFSQRIAYVVLQDYLFPGGEPTAENINPPAGERWGQKQE